MATSLVISYVAHLWKDESHLFGLPDHSLGGGLMFNLIVWPMSGMNESCLVGLFGPLLG